MRCTYDEKDTCATKWVPYQNLFKTEVHDRAQQIDQNNELDWYSLTVGWAIAHGMDPETAEEFAVHIRYHTDLG